MDGDRTAHDGAAIRPARGTSLAPGVRRDHRLARALQPGEVMQRARQAMDTEPRAAALDAAVVT